MISKAFSGLVRPYFTDKNMWIAHFSSAFRSFYPVFRQKAALFLAFFSHHQKIVVKIA
jgi:hypothetical protein